MEIEFPVMEGSTFDPSQPLYWNRGPYGPYITQAETSRGLNDWVLEPIQYAVGNNGKPLFGLSGPLYIDGTGVVYRVIQLEGGLLSLAYRDNPREYATDLVCAGCGGPIIKQVQEDGVQNFSCPACDTRRYHGSATVET